MKQPIRVLQLFTIMNRGGAETMIMNYYRNIDRSKVQFDFMVHRNKVGDYEDEIRSLGGKIYRMPPIRPNNIKQYKKLLLEFFTEHKEYKIIHSNMSELGLFVFQAAANAKVPIRICHAHNSPKFIGVGVDEYIKRIPRVVLKQLIRLYTTHFFVCSIDAGNWLFGKKNASKFIQMNNAVDAEMFRFNAGKRVKKRIELGIEDSFVVGHVGRFEKQKNHRFLLDVFRKLLHYRPNACLLLIGTGPDEVFINKLVKKKGIENKVIFAGVRSDVNELMQAMDVFVFPSIYEGLPVTLIEAQAAGLSCVISTNIPTQCIITNCVYRMSLDKNPSEWAAFILEKSLPATDTYEEIRKAGFDIKKNAGWLQEVYMNAMHV